MPLEVSQKGSHTTRSFSDWLTYHSKFHRRASVPLEVSKKDSRTTRSVFVRAHVPLEVSQKGSRTTQSVA